MAGKWTKFRHTLPKFKEEPSFQAEIDALKPALAKLPTPELTKIFCKAVRTKEAIEAKIHEANVQLFAADQVLLDRLLDEDLEKLTLRSGGVLYVKDNLYPFVTNRAKLFSYIKQHKMLQLLSVHFKTLTGIVKDNLKAGHKPPPGVDVFIKTRVGHKGVKRGRDSEE